MARRRRIPGDREKKAVVDARMTLALVADFRGHRARVVAFGGLH